MNKAYTMMLVSVLSPFAFGCVGDSDESTGEGAGSSEELVGQGDFPDQAPKFCGDLRDASGAPDLQAYKNRAIGTWKTTRRYQCAANCGPGENPKNGWVVVAQGPTIPQDCRPGYPCHAAALVGVYPNLQNPDAQQYTIGDTYDTVVAKGCQKLPSGGYDCNPSKGYNGNVTAASYANCYVANGRYLTGPVPDLSASTEGVAWLGEYPHEAGAPLAPNSLHNGCPNRPWKANAGDGSPTIDNMNDPGGCARGPLYADGYTGVCHKSILFVRDPVTSDIINIEQSATSVRDSVNDGDFNPDSNLSVGLKPFCR